MFIFCVMQVGFSNPFFHVCRSSDRGGVTDVIMLIVVIFWLCDDRGSSLVRGFGREIGVDSIIGS